MSSLRSAIDELLAEDVSGIDTDSLKMDVIEGWERIETQRADWLRRVAELDHRGAHLEDGHTSLTSWLADRCRLGATEARGLLRLARSLREIPRTAAAYLRGAITSAHVRVLARAASAHPEAYERDEEVLVESAISLSALDLSRAVAYWRGALDDWAEADRLFDRRHLFASRTYGGVVRVDGELDPEGGEVVLCALAALSETLDDSDARSPAQRRADALVELSRRALDQGDLPERGGERPHLIVTLDLESLEGRAGRRCETDGGAVLSPEGARRLACDASVSRVILHSPSEPIEVGRKTRVVPARLRRAVVVRDRGCRWQGCDRPPRWSDVHHLRHWADGGETSLANLVLLCRRHHRMVHEGRRGLDLVGRSPP